MDNLELEQKAEVWVRAVKKAEEKIKREEEEKEKEKEKIEAEKIKLEAEQVKKNRLEEAEKFKEIQIAIDNKNWEQVETLTGGKLIFDSEGHRWYASSCDYFDIIGGWKCMGISSPSGGHGKWSRCKDCQVKLRDIEFEKQYGKKIPIDILRRSNWSIYKKDIVNEYKNTPITFDGLCKKYNIPSKTFEMSISFNNYVKYIPPK